MTFYTRDNFSILHLPMSKRWFDLIALGYKKEEYRLFKEHWKRRIQKWWNSPKEKVICFRNGYGNAVPIQYRLCHSISHRDHSIHPEWGEDMYKDLAHYVLGLGDAVRFV